MSGSGYSGDATRKAVHRRVGSLETEDMLRVLRSAGYRNLLYRFSSNTSHDFGLSDQFANFALCILPALLFRNMNRCMFDEFSFYLLLTPSDCARSILNNISTM